MKEPSSAHASSISTERVLGAYETVRGTGEKLKEWPDNTSWIYTDDHTTGNVYLCSAPQNAQSFSFNDLNK
jgi:hypothetical protein